MRKDPDAKPYSGPAGGWGSVQSLIRNSRRQGAIRSSLKELPRQNKVGGFACVSCAWAKPADPHPFEFCENGAKEADRAVAVRSRERSLRPGVVGRGIR